MAGQAGSTSSGSSSHPPCDQLLHSRDTGCPPTAKNEPLPVVANPAVPVEEAGQPAPTAGWKPWPVVARLAVRARDMMLRVMIAFLYSLYLLRPVLAIRQSCRLFSQGKVHRDRGGEVS